MKFNAYNWNADGCALKYFKTLSLWWLSFQILSMAFNNLNDWDLTYCASFTYSGVRNAKKKKKIKSHMYVWKVYMKDKESRARSRSRRKGEWIVRTSDCVTALKTSWHGQWGILVPLWRNYSSSRNDQVPVTGLTAWGKHVFGLKDEVEPKASARDRVTCFCLIFSFSL